MIPMDSSGLIELKATSFRLFTNGLRGPLAKEPVTELNVDERLHGAR